MVTKLASMTRARWSALEIGGDLSSQSEPRSQMI
jgi:hypothetical protein